MSATSVQVTSVPVPAGSRVKAARAVPISPKSRSEATLRSGSLAVMTWVPEPTLG